VKIGAKTILAEWNGPCDAYDKRRLKNVHVTTRMQFDFIQEKIMKRLGSNLLVFPNNPRKKEKIYGVFV
jgi:hypothetical protein